MRDIIIGLDQAEEAVLSYEIADEALEAVAGTAQGAAGRDRARAGGDELRPKLLV
jgi:hypothetical protein